FAPTQHICRVTPFVWLLYYPRLCLIVLRSESSILRLRRSDRRNKQSEKGSLGPSYFCCSSTVSVDISWSESVFSGGYHREVISLNKPPKRNIGHVTVYLRVRRMAHMPRRVKSEHESW